MNLQFLQVNDLIERNDYEELRGGGRRAIIAVISYTLKNIHVHAGYMYMICKREKKINE